MYLSSSFDKSSKSKLSAFSILASANDLALFNKLTNSFNGLEVASLISSLISCLSYDSFMMFYFIELANWSCIFSNSFLVLVFSLSVFVSFSFSEPSDFFHLLTNSFISFSNSLSCEVK